MLVELSIKEFAIIEKLKINFNKGLNILTGETGAGKSIIIDAIQLIIGGRGSIEYIRTNAEKAEIEALFDMPKGHPVYKILHELDVDYSEDEMLFIKRELFINGKSICRINGQIVTLAVLKEVGQWIIQLYSQLQHQQLLHNDKQLALLDAYGELSLAKKKDVYKTKYDQYISLKKEIFSLSEDERITAQKIDLLQYQIQEINQANLHYGEEEELIKQKNIIKHSEKISNALNNSYENLSRENGITDLLAQTIHHLEQVSIFDDKIKRILDDVSSTYYQLKEISSEINDEARFIDFDSNEVNSIEERLSVIYYLKRKYGDSIEAIINYLDKNIKELDLIQNKDIHLNNIKDDLIEITKLLLIEALEISKIRKVIANELSLLIEKELDDLQMNNTKIKIDVSFQEELDGIAYSGKKYNITQLGLDKVDFLISTNLGEPLKPLNKIASGGELSRIMLAVLTILAHKEQVTTIIFDEIDTGVSGKAAQAIAEKLAKVSKTKQVFVITHLPQVASMADYHYLIQKNIDNEITKTEIGKLDDENKIKVIAHMLGGVEVTDITYKHAEEMIDKAQLLKKTF